MAAEVAAFLLTQKLQNLRDDDIIIYPRLKRKINSSIFALQQLLSSSDDSDVTSSRALPFIYSAEDTFDTYLLSRAQQRRKDFIETYPSFQYLAPLWSQKDLGKGLKKFLNDLKALRFHSSEQVNPESRVLGKTQEKDRCLVNAGRFGRWDSIAHLLDKESNIVGQISDMGKMVSELMMTSEGAQGEEALRVVSVVGSGGSGKTTMVRRVYNRVDVKKHFECCAWVRVSREFVFKNVVMSIIEQVSINRLNDVDHMNEEVLVEKLFKELIDKRYLIVLDDVCDAEAWHQLTIPFPDSKNGSRVILTTCDDKVARLADPWNLPSQMCRLTNEERWELLLKKMKEHEGGLTEYKDKIMAKLCRGSPLGIVLLGGILLNTEPSEWAGKIDKFPSSWQDERALRDILALSYQELPPELKACFLYLVIFPIASDISVRRLLWLWLSEGFLDGLPGTERKEREPEDMAELYFQRLVSRNLIEVTKWKLDGCPKMCRMPGVIHEFFFPKSVDLGILHIDENSSRPPENCKVRRLMEFLKKQNSLDSFIDPSLRSYTSFNSTSRGTANRDIGTFLMNVIQNGGFRLLKVLDLEGVYKPVLPESMRNLLLLRFLGLRSTVLDSIPSAIGQLPCLETLDLKHTNVTAIPSSIWEAKSLRHFCMNEVHIDAFVHKPSKGSLTNLHTLKGLYVGDKKAVVNGLDRLVKLRKLGLTCHKDSLKAVAKWIKQLTNLQSLKLRSVDKFGKPSKLEGISMAQHLNLCNLYLLGSLPIRTNQLSRVLPSCLRKLTLSKSKLVEDPMEVLGQLKDLTILRLFAHSYVGSQMTCVSGGFPKLRVLKLWMLDELQHWTVQDQAMPLLQELEIRRCKQLENSDVLEHLPSLNEVVLTDMPQSFVEEVRKSIANDVFLKVNDWKFSH
ncbi:putative inactive disease susceptibility protein LOV1 [Rhodamnia argentea]|uniref:Inactive disease susceptibility protein LOV1 n=1 Tax=Rhodamnia argentea TaxID=178133 RepID=A0A8B8NU46_9MYRT|nr:putative inactive disease susceptibility protein LOV1 [Rhodamnia argentea]